MTHAVPVSLFVTRPGIKDVTLTIEPDDFFAVVGERSVHVKFERPEARADVDSLADWLGK